MTSQRDAIRLLSRQAFGQAYRLEAMLAVAEQPDGLVSLSELAVALEVSVSNLQAPLRSMVETGLLSELPRGDSRRKFYLRNESAAWLWAQELAAFAAVVPQTTE